jgi:hypothetical protein
MSKNLTPTRVLAAAALCAAGLYWSAWRAPLAGAEAGGAKAKGEREMAKEWQEKGYKYQNAAACSRCHVQPTGNDIPKPDQPKAQKALNLVLLTEYSIWKTHDKHAQAYAVLEGPRGRQMGEMLGIDVTKKEAGCLNCHAMNNLAGNADEGGLDLKDGVSCGGCHGPSTAWIGPHIEPAWRKLTAAQKSEKGLRDLRDPEVRSRLCMSCHVGSPTEGKVVTHAMFAVGHPPLPPIEIATFSRNEPQHWRNAADVPLFKDPTPQEAENYHLKDMNFQRTRLALVGSVVALRETMRLAGDRADFNTREPAVLWPELIPGPGIGKPVKVPDADTLRREAPGHWPELAMAHSDCFACHHDLKYPGYRQLRGFGYQLSGRTLVRVRPGRPLVRAWPTALLEAGAAFSGRKEEVDALEKRLNALVQACNERPFGEPAGIARATGDAAAWCDNFVGALRDARYDNDSVLGLMHHLCSLYDSGDGARGPTPAADYESAKQVAAVLQVAYEDWKRNKGGSSEGAENVLKDLSEKLNLEPYVRRPARLKVVFDVVQKASGGTPLAGQKEFAEYLKDIGKPESIRQVSQTSPFLAAVRGISNDDFNSGLVKDHIKELQEFGDEEEKITLKAVSDYDPEAFRASLRAFAKALPPAKR